MNLQAREEARKLRVFDFNDQASDILKRSASTYLDIETVRTWQDAQQLLVDRGEPDTRGCAGCDIALVDVNFDQDSDLRGASWKWPRFPQGGELIGVGPLLALPFISGSDVVAFAPYSQHWKAIQKSKNGMLCTAVGMLISAVNREVLGASTVIPQVKGFAGFSNARDALKGALQSFRNTFTHHVEKQILSLTPVSGLISGLRDLAFEKRVDLRPLEKMAIVFQSSRGITRLFLASLFADKLGFTRELLLGAKPPVLCEIADWLDKLSVSDELIQLAFDAMAKLKKALSDRDAGQENQRQALARTDRVRLIKGVIETVCQAAPGMNNQVLRALVILANIEALRAAHLSDNPRPFDKSRVLEVLGLEVTDYRSYADLFGTRSTKRKGIYAEKFGKSVYMDDDPHLSLAEKLMCQLYAERELRWKQGYPFWME